MPSFSLHTVVSMSIAASALVMLILFYLQRQQVNRRATGYWALAYACLSLRLCCTLAGEYGYGSFAMAVDLFLLGFVLSLWLGVRAFNGEPVEIRRPLFLFAGFSAWIGFSHLAGIPFVWRAMPTHFFAGGMLLASALRFWRHDRLAGNSGYSVLASLIGLRGLHLFDYPFIRNVESLALFGFSLGALLDFSAGMMLLVAATLDQQRQTARALALLDQEMNTRKKTEQTLHDREQLFEKVFQLVPDVLVVCKEKGGQYVEVNRHWEPLTGYSPQETLGRNSADMGLWVDLAQRDAMVTAMKSLGEFWGLDATLRHKDGYHYFVKVSGVRVHVGDESFVSYTVQDVTAAREAEAYRSRVESQLREREKRFVKMFDLVPEIISIASVPDGILVDVNRNWEVVLGYSRAESIGRSAVHDLGLWPDPAHRAQLMQRLENENFVRGYDTVFRKKNGEIAQVETFCTLFETDGKRFMLAVVRDTTQRNNNEQARLRAEKNLRDSERHLRAVLNAMGEGVIVCDRDGHVVLTNAAAAAIHETTEQQMSLLHDARLFEFLREDGSPLDQQELPIWKTFQSGESQRNVTLGLRLAKGGVRWLYVSTDPVFSEEDPGHVEQVVIAMVDISRQKEAEALLREREAVLATVFQLVPDTLTITSLADGRYVDVNRNWEPLTGYTREEVLGFTSGELSLWSDFTQRKDLVQRVLGDGEVRGMQIDFRHKDGHVIHCRISGSKFSAGDQTYLLLSVQNIGQELATEQARVQAETLLRQNEHKYSTIFQLSPIALGLVNIATSELVEVNDVWLAQFGYARKDVIGRTATELGFWETPGQREKMIAEMRTQGRVDRFELRHRHKDGHVLICLMSARLFDSENGKMFIFSLLDVTRQYAIEKEIREMTAQLEARVKLRTLKLEQANAELADAMESLKHAQVELVRSEKMAALGSLVAGVAHELNTPIGNSVTVASTLEDKTRELLRDISSGGLRRSTLDRYLQSATTGTALLMRTLNVARELISSFKQVAVDQSSSQRRRFDLEKVLEEVIATLSPMYKKGPFLLATELSPGIMMDSFPGPLGQIITNFMTNALAHAFEGRNSGEMRLASRLRDDGYAEIIFSDNGAGIPEADQRRVFDPFFTTKLGQGGSGLGMNIVYNLVTGVLGGEIRLDSRVGEGTRFTLRLPLSAPQMSPDDTL
ncbi:PAS domain S-box protein [Undibacterium sp. TJN25]|uniref:PAS domain S-box protein n=1 Tax=Undibacterium sp. TJN25 TaxID=3413056 RepID=UPI003BEF811A